MTKLLHQGLAPEHRQESARGTVGDDVAEVVAGDAPDGWKNYPAGRSPGRADDVTTRGETGKLHPARCCRNTVDSTGPGADVED